MYARSSAFSLRLLFSFSSKYFESLLHDRTKPFEFDRINWFLINRPINDRSLLREEKKGQRRKEEEKRRRKSSAILCLFSSSSLLFLIETLRITFTRSNEAFQIRSNRDFRLIVQLTIDSWRKESRKDREERRKRKEEESGTGGFCRRKQSELRIGESLAIRRDGGNMVSQWVEKRSWHECEAEHSWGGGRGEQREEARQNFEWIEADRLYSYGNS